MDYPITSSATANTVVTSASYEPLSYIYQPTYFDRSYFDKAATDLYAYAPRGYYSLNLCAKDVVSVSFDDSTGGVGEYTIQFNLEGEVSLHMKMTPEAVERLLDMIDERYVRKTKAEMENFFDRERR